MTSECPSQILPLAPQEHTFVLSYIKASPGMTGKEYVCAMGIVTLRTGELVVTEDWTVLQQGDRWDAKPYEAL